MKLVLRIAGGVLIGNLVTALLAYAVFTGVIDGARKQAEGAAIDARVDGIKERLGLDDQLEANAAAYERAADATAGAKPGR